MPRRFIDISVALQAGIASDPAGGEPKIHYETHQESIPRMLRHFPGMTPDKLPGGEGWATEQCQISTHNGTHVDAPWHYATTMDGGNARRPSTSSRSTGSIGQASSWISVASLTDMS